MIRRSHVCVAALIAAALIASACHRNPKPQPPTATAMPATPAPTPTTPPPPPPPPPDPPAPRPAPPGEDEIFRSKSLDELNAEKPLADTFFAYDATALDEASRAALQKNVDWMKRWPTTKVMVEGHADSRGTTEYNLALGERRADAGRDYIVSLGIPADRVTIVSKGEEQPFCNEETESCWQQNRRGHFILTAK